MVETGRVTFRGYDMDLFQSLQGLLGQGLSGAAGGNQNQGGGSGMDGLSGLLNPNVLGGLANALLGSRSGGGSRGMGAGTDVIGGLLGALVSGGGASLFGGQQTDRIRDAYDDVPRQANVAAAAPRDRAARVIRALVYAAKSDGHIDAAEQAAIDDQLRKLNVGPEGQALVRQVVSEPLDPGMIANGVQDGQEALQLYVLSSVVSRSDHFMERNYLDALAKALRLPPDVKESVDAKVRGGR